MAQLRLPSGEVRYIDMNCLATIGQVSNPTTATLRRARRGACAGKRRPSVRGGNGPGLHPRGGGEGRSPVARWAEDAGKTGAGQKAQRNGASVIVHAAAAEDRGRIEDVSVIEEGPFVAQSH